MSAHANPTREDSARDREALDRIATTVETEASALRPDSPIRADLEAISAKIREVVPRRDAR